jgi:hypothetical protein
MEDPRKPLAVLWAGKRKGFLHERAGVHTKHPSCPKPATSGRSTGHCSVGQTQARSGETIVATLGLAWLCKEKPEVPVLGLICNFGIRVWYRPVGSSMYRMVWKTIYGHRQIRRRRAYNRLLRRSAIDGCISTPIKSFILPRRSKPKRPPDSFVARVSQGDPCRLLFSALTELYCSPGPCTWAKPPVCHHRSALLAACKTDKLPSSHRMQPKRQRY